MFRSAPSGFGPFWGEIVESVWTVKPDYDPETLLLEWTIAIEGPAELIEKGTTQWTISFPTGKKHYQTLDGGETAEHVSGAVRRFGETSRMGMLCDRAFGDPKDHEEGKATMGMFFRGEPIQPFGLMDYFMENSLSVLKSQPWVGFKMYFWQDEFHYGAEIGTRTPDMPVKVLAMPDGSAPPEGGLPLDELPIPPVTEAPAPKKKAAKKKAVAKKSPEKAEAMMSLGVWRSKIEELIEEAEEYTEGDYNSFYEAAVTMAENLGVQDSEEHMDLLDEEGGVWAEYDFD